MPILMKLSQNKSTLLAIVGIFLVFYTQQYFNKALLPGILINQPIRIGNGALTGKNQNEVDLTNQLCRISRWKTDWRSLIAPCKDATPWENEKSWDRSMGTDPNKTLISMIDLKPAGEISRIFITTKTSKGLIKTIGGDSWRVKITGTASISATVIDLGNGTYEVAFLCYDHGTYFISIDLDYTLCDGLKDPPKDWFVRGNSQGKYQGIDVIGKPQDFLMHPLKGTPLKIVVKKRRVRGPLIAPVCRDDCKFIWNGNGRWRNVTWISFFDGDLQRIKRDRVSRRKAGHLLVYGDSVNVFFANSLQHRHKICRRLFKSCSFSYNWVYKVENVSVAKKQRDNKDFNVTKVIEDFKKIIFVPLYNNSESIVIVNFGLHFVESTNFSNYKQLIKRFVELISPQDKGGEKKFMGNVIWKTTTAINKERADYPQLHWRRFFTNYRIQLYNAYASDIMCLYGIPVIDAYPISESYPFGTGTHAGRLATRNDIVHYNNEAFYPIEEFLEEIFDHLDYMR